MIARIISTNNAILIMKLSINANRIIASAMSAMVSQDMLLRTIIYRLFFQATKPIATRYRIGPTLGMTSDRLNQPG